MRNHIIDEALLYMALVGLLFASPLAAASAYYWGPNVLTLEVIVTGFVTFAVAFAAPLIAVGLRALGEVYPN